MSETQLVDRLIDSWCTRHPLSEHTSLEVAYAVHVGHQAGDPPPLGDGRPVPGCSCPRCADLDEDDDVWALFECNRDESEPLPVEEARGVSILDVCRRLGLGDPASHRAGSREFLVRCPLHDDTNPSLRLRPGKGPGGVWYCFPCGEGGDGIKLVMRAQRMEFHEAVKWIAKGGG